MPRTDPIARRAYQRDYMRMRYQTDEVHRKKQIVRAMTKYLDKEEFCSRCGAPNPEAHHPDYDKPKEVLWLCRDCHLGEHGIQTRGALVGSRLS